MRVLFHFSWVSHKAFHFIPPFPCLQPLPAHFYSKGTGAIFHNLAFIFAIDCICIIYDLMENFNIFFPFFYIFFDNPPISFSAIQFSLLLHSFFAGFYFIS